MRSSPLMHGLSVLRTPSRFASVLGWTLAHWLMNALAFWFAFKAVHIDAPYSAALFLQGLIAIGVAAPQAPGMSSSACSSSSERRGWPCTVVGADAAATWAISFHFLSYVPITVIGAWYFLREGLTLAQIGSLQKDGTDGIRWRLRRPDLLSERAQTWLAQ